MENKNILYTFRRCPFAMRARWAILKLNLVVVWREVSLKSKPDELMKASPKGTVPVLITSKGKVIDESIEIMKWAVLKNNRIDLLRTNCNYKRKSIESLVLDNDNKFKYHLDRYKYSNRYIKSEEQLHREKARNLLIKWSKLIKSNICKDGKGWLIDDKESFADWAIWPFVRQYRIANVLLFDNDNDLQHLRNWLFYYLEHNLYEKLMENTNPWISSDKEKYINPDNKT